MRFPFATTLFLSLLAALAVPHIFSQGATATVKIAARPAIPASHKLYDLSLTSQPSTPINTDRVTTCDAQWNNETDSFEQLHQCHLTTRDDVRVYLLPTDENDGSFKNYPLVVSPKSVEQKSMEFLSTFMEDNRDWINKKMIQYGAVLFRGFHVKSAMDVQEAVVAYEPNLSDVYRGTSPRHSQGGTRFVFSAAEVPSHYPIAQHSEMSFLKEVPPKLFFSALSAPKTIGGETALTDVRKVYQDLPDNLRQKLQQKKLRYTRTHTKDGEKFTHDVAAMLSWPEMFRTDNKTRVEELSAEEGMPVRWEGETFVSEFHTEAFQLHPETGEPVWYNHVQVFHWTSFPAELFSAFQRTGDLRYLGRAVLIGVQSIIKYGLMGHKMALHVAFGDGEPISIREAHQIRTAIHQNTYYNRWEQGDIVAIDNWSTAHGRSPTYDSGRNIVVAWTSPVLKQDSMKAL